MSEQLLAIAIENANATYKVVASSIPKNLELKESELLEWYAKLKGNPQTKLRSLFDFMSKLYDVVNKFTPCKKGCTSCCYYPVSISDVEIKLIERETGRKRSKVTTVANTYQGLACPFLQNNACSIYDHRPFVCRRHVTLTKTSHWCDPERANTAKFPLLKFSEVDRVFNKLIKEAGTGMTYDIRQVFSDASK